VLDVEKLLQQLPPLPRMQRLPFPHSSWQCPTKAAAYVHALEVSSVDG